MSYSEFQLQSSPKPIQAKQDRAFRKDTAQQDALVCSAKSARVKEGRVPLASKSLVGFVLVTFSNDDSRRMRAIARI